jgi:O-antigen ligase
LSEGHGWRVRCAAVLAALPWLNPYSFGPTPAVVHWLVGMSCGLGLWLLAFVLGQGLRWRTAALAAGLVSWAWLVHTGGAQEVLFLAAGLGLMVAAASAVVDPDAADGMEDGVLLAAALSAVLGLLQYFGFAGALSPWVNHANVGEAYANLRQPNQYASLCWLGVAVLLWGRRCRPEPLAAAAIMLLAAASAASVSRTGMLQGMTLTLLAVLWPGPARAERLRLCIAAAVAYVAATVLLPLALEAYTGAMPARTLWGRIGGGDSCSSRMVLWANVLQLIALRPLVGWGWGELDFAHFATLYSGARFCEILDNAHNLPLHFAVELGVPISLTFFLGIGWFIARQRPWKEVLDRRRLAWGWLAVVALHSLLEYPLWYGPFQMVTGAAIGLLLAPEPMTNSGLRRAAAASAGVILLAMAYAAWDYTRVSQVYLAPEERLARWRADPLQQAQRSWLFANQARFARLTLATPSRANAQWLGPLAADMLHYSPEPRVIERAIESATLQGRDDQAALYLARYRAAFPKEHAEWRARQGLLPAQD